MEKKQKPIFSDAKGIEVKYYGEICSSGKGVEKKCIEIEITYPNSKKVKKNKMIDSF